MTTQEIKSTAIGTQLTFMCYGMRVFGRVTGIYTAKANHGEELVGLEISHDQVQWGQDVITKSVSLGSNLNTVKFI
jgi:hypothetical protein